VPKPAQKLLTTGELAKLSNTPQQSIISYANRGIITPTVRDSRGTRLFSTDAVDKVMAHRATVRNLYRP
jgi:DNA-binding transcriptional MerR regulator